MISCAQIKISLISSAVILFSSSIREIWFQQNYGFMSSRNNLIYLAQKKLSSLKMQLNNLTFNDQIRQQPFFLKNYSRSFLLKSIFLTRKNQYISPDWIFHTLNTSLIISSPAKLAKSNNKEQTCEENAFQAFNQFYDPRCRDWYKQAVSTVGQIFTKPYQYALEKKVGMTLSMGLKKLFYSVFSIDFSMSNLGDHIFKNQDNYDEASIKEGYTVLVHQDNNTIFHHRYWSEQQNTLFSWQDIEYNSTIQYDQKDKDDFSAQIKEAIDFSQTQNYSIFDFINMDKFFIRFTKNDRKYISVLYPIDIKSYQYPMNRRVQKSQIVLYIGRVHFDSSGLLNEVVVNAKTAFIILNIIEAALVLIIVIISFLHYAAVFIRKLDFQLEILTQYLNQHDEESPNTNLKQNVKKNRRSIIQIANQTTQNTQYDRKTFTQSNSYCNSQKSIQEDHKNEKNFNNEGKLVKPEKINMKKQQGIFYQIFQFLFKQNKEKQKNQNENKQINQYFYQQININEVQYEFYEMSILIKSFQQLESVINLIKKGDQLIIGSISQKIMASSEAKQVFQSVNNNFGQGFCYFQLGQLYFQQRNYVQAAQNFEQSISSLLIDIHVDDICYFSEKIKNGNFNATINQCKILLQRLFFFIVSMKEQALSEDRNNFLISKADAEDRDSYKEIYELKKDQIEDNSEFSNNLNQHTKLQFQEEFSSKKQLITEQQDEIIIQDNANSFNFTSDDSETYFSQKKQKNFNQMQIKNMEQINEMLINKQNLLNNCLKYLEISLNITNFLKKKQNQENQFESIEEFSSDKSRVQQEYQKELVFYLEFAEVYTHLSKFESASYFIFQAEKMVFLIEENSSENKDFVDFFQSKINYIFGTICIKRNLYKLGCYCLTQCLEETLIQDPIVVLRCLKQVQQVLKLFKISTDLIEKQIKKFEFLELQSDSSLLQPYFISKNGKILQETEEKQGLIDFLIVYEILPFESPEEIDIQKRVSYWIQKNYICSKDRFFISFYCCSKLLLTFQAKYFLDNRYFNLCIQQLRIQQIKVINEYQNLNPNALNQTRDQVSQDYYQKYESKWSYILTSSLEQFLETQNSLNDLCFFNYDTYDTDQKYQKQTENLLFYKKMQMKNCKLHQRYSDYSSNQNQQVSNSWKYNQFNQNQFCQNRQLIQVLFSFRNQKETLDKNFFHKYDILTNKYSRKKVKSIILQIPLSKNSSKYKNRYQNCIRKKQKKSLTTFDQKVFLFDDRQPKPKDLFLQNQLQKETKNQSQNQNLQTSFHNFQKLKSPSSYFYGKYQFSEQHLFSAEKKIEINAKNKLIDQFNSNNFNQDRVISPINRLNSINFSNQQIMQTENQSNFYTESDNLVKNNDNPNKKEIDNYLHNYLQNEIQLISHINQKIKQNYMQDKKSQLIDRNKQFQEIDSVKKQFFTNNNNNDSIIEGKLNNLENQQRQFMEEQIELKKKEIDEQELFPHIIIESNFQNEKKQKINNKNTKLKFFTSEIQLYQYLLSKRQSYSNIQYQLINQIFE